MLQCVCLVVSLWKLERTSFSALHRHSQKEQPGGPHILHHGGSWASEFLALPLGARDGDLFLSTAGAGLGVERPAVFSISPWQGLLFFLSCLLGSSSSLFFLQKGRKANLEHTQLTCHRRCLGPALGIGSLTVKRHRVGEPQRPALRNKEKEGECKILICSARTGPLHSFPLLTPPSRDFWLQLTQSPAWRGPAVQWPPPLSVHLFLLLNAWGSIPP